MMQRIYCKSDYIFEYISSAGHAPCGIVTIPTLCLFWLYALLCDFL